MDIKQLWAERPAMVIGVAGGLALGIYVLITRGKGTATPKELQPIPSPPAWWTSGSYGYNAPNPANRPYRKDCGNPGQPPCPPAGGVLPYFRDPSPDVIDPIRIYTATRPGQILYNTPSIGARDSARLDEVATIAAARRRMSILN